LRVILDERWKTSSLFYPFTSYADVSLCKSNIQECNIGGRTTIKSSYSDRQLHFTLSIVVNKSYLIGQYAMNNQLYATDEHQKVILVLARISHQIDKPSLVLCIHKEFSSIGNTHCDYTLSENPL